MDIISEKARNCLPYDLETRLHSVRRVVESGWSIRKAIAYYKVKRTTFWRWRNITGSQPNRRHRCPCPVAAV